ncbi:MAG: hypothetical protein ACJ703_09735 [Nitrososphaera sp.]
MRLGAAEHGSDIVGVIILATITGVVGRVYYSTLSFWHDTST